MSIDVVNILDVKPTPSAEAQQALAAALDCFKVYGSALERIALDMARELAALRKRVAELEHRLADDKS